jgi:YHS domain-containing protein
MNSRNMKTALTLIALAALAAGSFAQMGGVTKNSKHVIACPVTGETVDMVNATKSHMYADYKGNRYFFCCGDCPSQFKKNPAKFAKKPHIKTPKSK